MPFLFVNCGRYISVDANWLILRVKHPRTSARSWQVHKYDYGAREFMPVDGARFATLEMAKFYVSDLSDLPLLSGE